MIEVYNRDIKNLDRMDEIVNLAVSSVSWYVRALLEEMDESSSRLDSSRWDRCMSTCKVGLTSGKQSWYGSLQNVSQNEKRSWIIQDLNLTNSSLYDDLSEESCECRFYAKAWAHSIASLNVSSVILSAFLVCLQVLMAPVPIGVRTPL